MRSKCKQTAFFLAASWTFLVVGLAAARFDDAAASPAGEPLTAWEWMQNVSLLAQQGASPFVDFILTPSVFDRARVDLNDLRLYDARNREIPFKMEVRRGADRQAALTARSFNQVRNPDRSAAESHGLPCRAASGLTCHRHSRRRH